MNEIEKAKPSNYGFDLDFDDLANVKPIPAPSQPKKTLPEATALSKIAKEPPKKPEAKIPQLKKPTVRKMKTEAARSDAVAKSLGFKAREGQGTVLKKRRRTHHDEPVDQLSIRGPVRILNDFIDHCDKHNLAYWEALDQLLRDK